MLKNVSSMQIQKFATFNSDREQINLSPNKSFRYYNQYSSIIFRRIRIWLIFHNIFFYFFLIRLWKHLFLFQGFLIMKTTFSYFPGMFKNPAPAECYLKKIINIMKYLLYTNSSKNNRWLLFVISEWFVWN